MGTGSLPLERPPKHDLFCPARLTLVSAFCFHCPLIPLSSHWPGPSDSLPCSMTLSQNHSDLIWCGLKCCARPTLPGGREPYHNWNKCWMLIIMHRIAKSSLNPKLNREQKFRSHFVWDPAVVVRSRTVCWTEFAEPLPAPPASEFDNVEALETISVPYHYPYWCRPLGVPSL